MRAVVAAAVVLAGASCRCNERPAARVDDAAPAPLPVVEPAASGMAVYPARVELDGDPLEPPARPTGLRAVPGTSLAVLSGVSGETPAVQLVDVDAARVLWTDTEHCPGGAVHVTPTRVVCANAQRIDALNLADGRPVWDVALRFRAADGDRLVAVDERSGRAFVIDLDDSNVVATAMIDRPMELGAMCARRDGVELYAWSPAGELRAVRVTEADVARLWTASVGGAPSAVRPCDGDEVIAELPIAGSGERVLRAFGRADGVARGEPVHERGWWRAGDGGLVIADDDGVHRVDGALRRVRTVAPGVPAGRLLAERGELRLIRTVAGTVVALDGDRVRAWLGAPAYARHAVLGQRRVLVAGWVAAPSRAERAQVFELPAPVPGAAWPPAPVAAAGAIAAAPQPLPPAVDARGPEHALPGAGALAVGPIQVTGERLYAVVLEGRPGPDAGAGMAAFDLAKRRWLWHRADACAASARATGVVEVAGVVVCTAEENEPGAAWLTAVDRDTGAPAWRLPLPAVDEVVAAGARVVVLAGPEAIAVDTTTGVVAARWWSDSGHLPRVAAAGGAVITTERGELVARRLDGDGAVAWRAAVGEVADMWVVGDRLVVERADGRLTFVDPSDGSARATELAGLDGRAAGDLLVGARAAGDGALHIRAVEAGGDERFAAALAPGVYRPVAPRAGAGAALAWVERARATRVVEVDSLTGRVKAVVLLPARAAEHAVFTVEIDGKRVRGAVLAKPLAIKVL